MSLRLLIAAALLAVSQVAWAQGQRTRTSTTTLWLPSRPTSAGNNIYASVITAAPETTEYLLACATTFRSPYPSSCGDFAGVTLTHADGTMRIKFASDTYDCDRGESATCDITRAGETTPSATVLSDAESSAWFTAVTILAGQNKLSGGAARIPAGNSNSGNNNRNCRRASGKGGRGGREGNNRGNGGSRDDPCSGAATLRSNGLVASSLAVGGLLAAVVVFL